MSFKKSKQKSQPDLFATASFSLLERERRYMEDELSWHNEFYRNVLLNIDEEVLRPLFVDGNMGAPTKQLRILVAMRILKEGRGCSDEQLYENVRFDLELQEDGSLEVTDKQTAEVITATKVRSTSGRSLPTGRKKDGQWKIAVENSKGKKSYRYFDNDAIERSQNRQRMETIPWEERKKCNNVEATIFQYCFLTRNNKTRYRGLFKQTLQALARCAWINMRRLFLFDVNTANLALQKA